MIDNELLSVDNGTDKIIDADASLVAKEYYTSYAKYVLEYRALPSVYDGLKPVQRRIIYTANQYPQKLMKTAKLSGAVLAYHPHGSASVTGAINEMAHPLNVLPLFTTKGNFGGVGFEASADRYTECYLSDIARKIYCQFIDYAEYEVGEIGEKEPVALPSLLPYCLFKGSEGIGVGLSTKVMPLNLIDLIDYYIDYIKTDGHPKKFIKPDLGAVVIDLTDKEIKTAVQDRKGQLKYYPVVSQSAKLTYLIEGLYDKSIDAVINKLDKKYKWFTDGYVGFRDSSTTSIKYVFEIYNKKKADPVKFVEALKEAAGRTLTFSRVVEEDGNAIYASLNYVVKQSLGCLNSAIDRKVAAELSSSQSKLSLYDALELCKKKKVFDKVTTMTSDQLVDLIIKTSQCSLEIAQEIVKKPISYLTKSHASEIQSLQTHVNDLQNHDRKAYLLSLYKDLRKSVLPIYNTKLHSITQKEAASK